MKTERERERERERENRGHRSLRGDSIECDLWRILGEEGGALIGGFPLVNTADGADCSSEQHYGYYSEESIVRRSASAFGRRAAGSPNNSARCTNQRERVSSSHGDESRALAPVISVPPSPSRFASSLS